MTEPLEPNCGRCGKPADHNFDVVWLCEECLFLIVQEWELRRKDYAEIAQA